MMTVSGIAAWGLSPAVITRRIAAESVSPQLIAVLGRDTELRFAVIPVMRISVFDSVCKGIKNPPTYNEIFQVFLQKKLKPRTPSFSILQSYKHLHHKPSREAQRII